MRYLRQSIYDPNGRPVNQIVAETSLNADIHVCANSLRENGYPDIIDIEIFECSGGLLDASIEGKKRSEKRLDHVKRHQDTLRDWAIAMMEMVRSGGSIGTKSPAPLSADEIVPALTEAMKHQNYKNQSIIVLASNGRTAVMALNGKTSLKEI